jgi:hypothetical protein
VFFSGYCQENQGVKQQITPSIQSGCALAHLIQRVMWDIAVILFLSSLSVSFYILIFLSETLDHLELNLAGIIITRMHKISMFLQHGIDIRILTHVCVMKNSSSKWILCLQIWFIVQQYAYYFWIISNNIGVKLEINYLAHLIPTTVYLDKIFDLSLFYNESKSEILYIIKLYFILNLHLVSYTTSKQYKYTWPKNIILLFQTDLSRLHFAGINILSPVCWHLMEGIHPPFWIGRRHSEKSRGTLTNTTCYY